MTAEITSNPPETASTPRRTNWVLVGIYTFCAAWVVIVLAFSIFKPIKVLPRVNLAPGFAFTNQEGVRKTSEDYRGKLTIYSFTYADCLDGCAQTTPQMQSLRNALDLALAPDISYALATITVNPEKDTPEAWSQFATPYLANSKSRIPWDFLTGDPTLTRFIVGGGFSVFYQKNPADASIKLDPRFALVDGWGIIRAEYRGETLDIPLVMRDIAYLEDEIRNSQGVARYAYEAAHLFRCYP